MHQHDNEKSIRDASHLVGEIRAVIDCQIFDQAVFPVSDHGSPPVQIQGEGKSNFGYHGINNTVDIINPYKLFDHSSYFYESWSALRRAAITPQETEAESDLIEFFQIITDNPKIVQELPDQFIGEGLELIGRMPADVGRMRILRALVVHAARPEANNDFNDPELDRDFFAFAVKQTRLSISAQLVRRIVKRIRVSSAEVSPPFDGRQHRVLVITDGQHQRIPPNPSGMVVMGIGHTIFSEAWRANRMKALTKKPFHDCVSDPRSGVFAEPQLFQTNGVHVPDTT